jgi:hypothetical protein
LQGDRGISIPCFFPNVECRNGRGCKSGDCAQLSISSDRSFWISTRAIVALAEIPLDGLCPIAGCSHQIAERSTRLHVAIREVVLVLHQEIDRLLTELARLLLPRNKAYLCGPMRVSPCSARGCEQSKEKSSNTMFKRRFSCFKRDSDL